MTKLKKISLISSIVIVALIAITVVMSLFGWKLFGFKFCISPNDYYASVVINDDLDHIVLMAHYPSNPYYALKGNALYHLEGNTLYVGCCKADIFDAIFGNLGGPLMRAFYPPEGAVIDKVVACGGGDEKVIWTREEGNIN